MYTAKVFQQAVVIYQAAICPISTNIQAKAIPQIKPIRHPLCHSWDFIFSLLLSRFVPPLPSGIIWSKGGDRKWMKILLKNFELSNVGDTE
jgi:hypothetical protein